MPDHVQAITRPHARGFFARFLKIVTVLDESHAECSHRGVLLDAVSAGHVHGRR
jgi:hypothetical protein